MSSLKDFEVTTCLGTGSFSSVYKARRLSDGQEYALKKVKLPSLNSKEKENALNEVRILASINHKNIIGYKNAFYDDASQCLCIVMEFASGGDLFKKINDYKKKGTFISEETVWSYLIQMTQGLKALHDMKILHRDLKCANVFLASDGKTIKLGDLNVSKVAEQGLVYTQTGTPYYASPEIWQDKPYGVKSDIWSLGCVVYELCSLLPPFRATNMNGLYQRVLKGIYDRIPTCFSDELSKVIGLCLNVQPNNRPTCDKLLSNPSVMVRMADVDVPTFQKVGKVHNDLLDTIKMPRNIKKLTEILPKANYKAREITSLVDIDERADTDRKRPSYKRPSSRLARAKTNAVVKYLPTSGDNTKDNSLELEKLLMGKENLPPIDRRNKINSLPPTDPKRSEKSNLIQRAGMAVLNDVYSVDRSPRYVQEYSVPDIEKKPALGNHRKLVDPRNDGIINARKGSEDILSNIGAREKMIKKEDNIFYAGGAGPRPRIVRAIY